MHLAAIARRALARIPDGRHESTRDLVRELRDHFVARQQGNLAFVEYDQTITAPGAAASASPSREYRVLVKDGGQWKIASQITHVVNSFGGTPGATGGRIDGVTKPRRLHHFARAFRTTAGVTPRAFVEQRRLERAKQLLERSDETLAAISLQCGFVTQRCLTTTFRRRTGFTPAAYRRGRGRRRALATDDPEA